MSLLAVGTVAFDQIETPFGKRDRALGGSATYLTLAVETVERLNGPKVAELIVG